MVEKLLQASKAKSEYLLQSLTQTTWRLQNVLITSRSVFFNICYDVNLTVTVICLGF